MPNSCLTSDIVNTLKIDGSSGRTRTYNPPVNRIMQVCYLFGPTCLLERQVGDPIHPFFSLGEMPNHQYFVHDQSVRKALCDD